jgi:hypothetical protein
MEAGGRLTLKPLWDVPDPGTAETAGFSVPLTLMWRRCKIGVEPPDLVVPADSMVQRVPLVLTVRPLTEILAVWVVPGLLLQMKTVRLFEESREAQARTSLLSSLQDKSVLPKTLER